MTPAPVAGSFRDPSGHVFIHDGRLYRQVNHRHREHYDRLLDSGLYETLVERGLLVAHDEVGDDLATSPDAYRVIEPERIGFISYPYEWCFSQLKAAALATLDVQRQALDHGMSLRDASAYNIQFRAGRPVLIDTLSFEVLPEGRPWVAYRQFCQHFLAPLALMSLVDVRLGQLLRVHLDGIPLDLAATLLPKRTKLRPALLLHIHQHASSQQRHAGDATGPGDRRSKFSRTAFEGLVDHLAAAIRKLEWQLQQSAWVDYYKGDSYSHDAFTHKQTLVKGFLSDAQPATVWDLGANTGGFSRLAAEAGATTVSFELDPSSVEAGYRRVVEAGEVNLLPLVADLTNPSPAIGFANAERDSLAQRGPADLVLALALIHHLAIANNVPLDRVAAWLHGLCQWLVIEFVPKTDAKAQVLLATREDIFDAYTQDGFEAAFAAYFDTVHREPITSSERTLYLLRAH